MPPICLAKRQRSIFSTCTQMGSGYGTSGAQPSAAVTLVVLVAGIHRARDVHTQDRNGAHQRAGGKRSASRLLVLTTFAMWTGAVRPVNPAVGVLRM